MEYSSGCEIEDVIKKEDFCYNEELDSIFKDINDFSHHDPTITYNDPLLDISNTQVGNKIPKFTNFCEPFLEQHSQGTLKTETFTATKDNSNFEVKNIENKLDNGNIFKINSKKIDSSDQIDFFDEKIYNADSFKMNSKESREDITKNGSIKMKTSENFCFDSFKINTKELKEEITQNGLNKTQTNENVCGECGEDCEDWIKLLAHVCKNKPNEKVRTLKKKTSHRSVIVITDDVDENGKAIEYKVRLQDVNNNVAGKVPNDNVVQKMTIDNVVKKMSSKGGEPKKMADVVTKTNLTGSRNVHQQGFMGGNEYPCNECDRVFKRVCNLTQHQKAAHLGIHYSCNQCGQLFKSTSMLLRHVNLTHEKIKPFKLASKAQFLNENASMKTANSKRPDVKNYIKPQATPRYWQTPKQEMPMGSFVSGITSLAKYNDFQNKPAPAAPLIKSKPITGFSWQMEPNASKETKILEFQNNGASFQKTSNDINGTSFKAKNVCSGVGPHLHMEGHSLNGIPILQSCKSQFVIAPPQVPPFVPPPIPPSVSPPVLPFIPPPVVSSTQAGPWPVWLTHRATAEPSNGRCSVYDSTHRPRSMNGPRKGPWSVNGSLPYLRISLSSG